MGAISTPSIILSLGIGMFANFKMVGNRSMVAASYIETYTGALCFKFTQLNIVHTIYHTHQISTLTMN